MPTVWRIVKRMHATTAFDGEGARRFGGRWNSPGRRAVYVSATKALATLEILVHLDVAQPIPRLTAFSFEVDEGLVQHVAAGQLPRHWRTLRGLPATQRFGDAWLRAGRSLALAVPSVVVPEELTYVLNPEHPAFARLKFGAPTPFRLDPRLVG